MPPFRPPFARPQFTAAPSDAPPPVAAPAASADTAAAPVESATAVVTAPSRPALLGRGARPRPVFTQVAASNQPEEPEEAPVVAYMPPPPSLPAMVGETPEAILAKVFGYDSFRGQQGDIIHRTIGGGDSLVLMPTGGGKSVCYQIPSVARPGVGIIVSPLLALMRDQVQALQQAGVRAGALNSDMPWEEIQRIEKAMRSGEIDVVYAAPERFSNPNFLRLLSQCKIALFAIDEAHCVSQWGHDFRPEYLTVGKIVAGFKGVPRIALTGTADPATKKDILERLYLNDAEVFLSSFDRPNIKYMVEEKGEWKAQLLNFLSRHKGESGIVYCLSRNKVEETAAFLKAKGYDAVPYHAKLDRDVKQANQDYFMKGEAVVAVATVAFGMGIDKPDVRFVAHVDLPGSLEAYYQETGRAGRDGLAAEAWMIYGLADIVQRRGMIDESEADDAHKRVNHQRLQSLVGYVESPECRRGIVLRYFGEEHHGNCCNCDRCLSPVKTYDGTADAKALLLAAQGTKERFGGGYLVDVVCGARNKKIEDNRHTTLPAFGIGSDRPKEVWTHLLRQLVSGGLLVSPPGAHGGLVLTDEGRAVLRGERDVALVQPSEKGVRRVRDGAARHVAEDLPPARRELFEALRKVRSELARAQNVAAYMIFNDATLLAMVTALPNGLSEMSRIPGVGSGTKLNNYGEHFLAAIAAHQDAPRLPDRLSVPFGR